MNTCGGCPKTWVGLSMAHCAYPTCHQTFSSVALFDVHRTGGSCSDPGSMLVKSGARAGLPLMRLNDRGVWVGNQPRPTFWDKQDAA